MSSWLDKIGLGHQRHCEKTSFITAFSLVALIVSIFLFLTKGYTTAYGFIWLFGLSSVAGIVGVIGYKIQKNKPVFHRKY